METVKSYTDISQSKKLAEILPLDSADMCYIKHSSSDNPSWEFNEDFPSMILGNVPINEITAETLPCWSLSALLELIPIECKLEKTLLDQSDYFTYACEWTGEYRTFEYEDPLDAAFEMICWLKENNKL